VVVEDDAGNTKDWEALASATRALRRLNQAVLNHEAADETLVELTEVIDQRAAQFESGAQRVRGADLMTFAHMRAFRDGTMASTPIGERVNFDPFSPGGGYLHPSSVGFDARLVDDSTLIATATVGPMFQGPPGRVHGGILALLVDEILGTLMVVGGLQAFTARLEVTYLAAAPTGAELTFRAEVGELQGRNLTIRTEGTSSEGKFLEAEGLFITVDMAKIIEFDSEN
jgi:acyl-coenzyme A thioesterase PaaI-like protein